jgi:chemotaxis protein CheC
MSIKILLVDDSAMARRNVRQMLEGKGYDVVEAEDGMTALERYFLDKPDLVLLDLVMKGMRGLDVLDKLHEMRRAQLSEQAGRSRQPAERRVRRARGVCVMELTAVQEDALVELLNIGFGRAASSLSQLTGHRVLLDVPQVTLHAIDQVGEALGRVVQGHVASVHQIFTGPVSGDALLILDESGAAILKELLTNEPALPLSIDASAREVITEVGNILLNACLGTFGNLLKVHVSFSVPHLSIENVGAILESLMVSQQGIRYALVVHAGFRLRDTQVTGYLMIVLSVASLDRLIRAVEDWELSQHAS